jgi:hypothetical protein
VSEPVTALRQLVATERGLPEESATFLSGETLEQIEASASAFEKLLEVEERRKREPMPSFLVAAATAKHERKRSLENLLTRRPQQRDEHGRFAGERTGTGGFDGGARRGPPAAAESPDEILIRVLRSREADRGAGF